MPKRILRGLTAIVLLAAAPALAQPNPPAPEKSAQEKPAAKVPSQLNDAEKKFQETLSGATLAGYFTEGNNQVAPQEERYTIHQVSKIGDELWLFQARIQYGERDLTLPLPLRVVWAGQTPVITLDNLPIPPLGNFSARVVIHGGKYAGTWSGGDHGGHLFGRVIPRQPAKK